MQETCQRSKNSVGSSDCMVWQTVHVCTRTAVPHPAAREAVLEQKTACLQEPLAACLTSHNSYQAVCRRCQHHLSGSRRAVQFKRSQQRYMAFIRTLVWSSQRFPSSCMHDCVHDSLHNSSVAHIAAERLSWLLLNTHASLAWSWAKHAWADTEYGLYQDVPIHSNRYNRPVHEISHRIPSPYMRSTYN
jgi:hypothetical protein